MKKYMNFVFASFIFLAVAACSEPVTEKIVVGKYVANHGIAIDTIEVRSDGTYRHYYKEAGGEEYINENRWELELVDKKPAVVFSGFNFKLPGYGGGSNGYYPAFVEKSFFGRIRLCIDPDLGYYYEKSDSDEH